MIIIEFSDGKSVKKRFEFVRYDGDPINEEPSTNFVFNNKINDADQDFAKRIYKYRTGHNSGPPFGGRNCGPPSC
jgi:hypothetical protein